MKFAQRVGLVGGAVAWLLAGCGGGSETAGTSAARESAAAVATGFTITGTAATGDALAGAKVSAKCASAGSGAAIVGKDGRFTLKASGALPCVLEVPVATMGITLHGALVAGSAANLTPLTELALDRLAGGSAASLFKTFNGTAQKRLSAANVAQALDALRTALKGSVDLGSDDPFTIPFVVNDAHDRKLDDVMDALTLGRTALAEFGSALAASGATPGTTATLLQPAARSCRSLRTGRYRVVDPTAANKDGTVLEVDAGALSARLPGSAAAVPLLDQSGMPASTLSGRPVGPCSYGLSEASGSGYVMVGSSGASVLVRQRSPGAALQLSLAVPEQSLPLAKLAGTWTMLQYARTAAEAPMTASFTDFSLTSTGKLTPQNVCVGTTCTPATGLPAAQLRASADGGFTLGVSGQPAARAFAFKTPDGHLVMLVRLPGNAGLAVATQQQALLLPALGSITRYWDLSVANSGAVGMAYSYVMTIEDLDAGSSTITRHRSDGRVELQTLNQPLSGLRNRATNACTFNGASVSCIGVVTMPVPGSGLTVYAGLWPSTVMGVAVDQP